LVGRGSFGLALGVLRTHGIPMDIEAFVPVSYGAEKWGVAAGFGLAAAGSLGAWYWLTKVRGVLYFLFCRSWLTRGVFATVPT
jgi:hypothetical protein